MLVSLRELQVGSQIAPASAEQNSGMRTSRVMLLLPRVFGSVQKAQNQRGVSYDYSAFWIVDSIFRNIRDFKKGIPIYVRAAYTGYEDGKNWHNDSSS